MREVEVIKLTSLIYKLETEVTERSIDSVCKFDKGRTTDCWMCCGFKSLFS